MGERGWKREGRITENFCVASPYYQIYVALRGTPLPAAIAERIGLPAGRKFYQALTEAFGIHVDRLFLTMSMPVLGSRARRGAGEFHGRRCRTVRIDSHGRRGKVYQAPSFRDDWTGSPSLSQRSRRERRSTSAFVGVESGSWRVVSDGVSRAVRMKRGGIRKG